MCNIFTYIWLVFMVNVGKYMYINIIQCIIHGSCGLKINTTTSKYIKIPPALFNKIVVPRLVNCWVLPTRARYPNWENMERRDWVPTNLNWLVVSTHLKNISQIGNLPQIGVKIKHIWNHHPVWLFQRTLLVVEGKVLYVCQGLNSLYWGWWGQLQ